MMKAKNALSLKKKLITAHKGVGKILFCRPFDKTDFSTNVHFIDYVIVPSGSSIGLHKHGDNEEVYYFVKGVGIMHIDKDNIQVKEGSIIINPKGGVHGFTNSSNTDVHIFVIEIGE